jgi:uncharacterized protein (DUF2141 family)
MDAAHMSKTSLIFAVAVAMAAIGLAVLFVPRQSVQATPTGAASLAVRVTGIAGTQGTILAAACDRTTFLKRCQYQQMEKITGAVLLRFDKLPPGSYAVMVFHDENDNLQFDRDGGGMPLEGYGFSRDARGRFGPPTFDDAAIVLAPGARDIAVALSY